MDFKGIVLLIIGSIGFSVVVFVLLHSREWISAWKQYRERRIVNKTTIE